MRDVVLTSKLVTRCRHGPSSNRPRILYRFRTSCCLLDDRLRAPCTMVYVTRCWRSGTDTR